MSAIRSRGRRGYTGVPNWRWEDPYLDSFERCVAGWLASHADGFVEDHVTGNEIARRTGFSRDRVQKALKKLAGLGIIEMTVGQPRNRLVITFDWDVWETPPAATRPVTGCHTAGDRPSHGQSTELHLYIGETQGEEQSEARWFDVFWANYPNKVGKPAALKAYRAAVKRAPREGVFAGLSRWKNHWISAGTTINFIPHPSTWLNQDRWNDDCPTVTSTATAPRERARAALEQLARRDDELS